MTQEEKARAYDEAIEKIKYVMEHGVSPVLSKEDLQDIFSELRESEDERIRKEIIQFIKKRDRSGCDYDYDKWIAWLEKQGEQIGEISGNEGEISPKIDGFDAELNALLKKYEHLSKKDLQEPLEFYLDVIKNDLDIVRENQSYHEGWINIYKHEYGYTLSREMCNTCEEAKKYWNKNSVATIKIEWEEQQ